ncbi:hypothetical protein ABEB36_007800, partial [Hypothenemus hampei]
IVLPQKTAIVWLIAKEIKRFCLPVMANNKIIKQVNKFKYLQMAARWYKALKGETLQQSPRALAIPRRLPPTYIPQRQHEVRAKIPV